MPCIKKRHLKSFETNHVIKLTPHFYEPFQIVHNINDVAFKLDLPTRW